MHLFNGCGVALITPFKNDVVDYDAFSRHLDRLLEAGVDALVPCGTTGEPSCMTQEEWQGVISFTVKKVNGKIPVIAGTGSNCTAQVIRRAHMAKDLGADAQLCVTPYYNKTTQDGCIAHFEAIADDGALPVYLYNVPSRTGLDLLPSTCARLVKHPNIVAIKDASGKVLRALELMNCCQDTALYCGDDQLVASTRVLGYHGVISVAANVLPKEMLTICHGTLQEAGKMQKQLYEFNRLLFCETSPAPAKAALSMMGHCENALRLPLIPMSNDNQQKLSAELKRLGAL